MSFTQIPSTVRRNAKENSSLLLSIGAGLGVLTTAYLTGRASFQAAHVFEDKDPDMELKERVRLVWKLYVPAATAAMTTIVCVVGVKHVDGRKILAAQTALTVSQKSYEAYRDQVVEQFGIKKDQMLLANVAEKQIQDNPPSTIIAGTGTVLCCELFTGRYFNSDMETLNRVVNEINAKMLRHDYATMDDFYYALGLEFTPGSGQSGWQSDKLLELEYSSILHNGRPCLAFGYNYVKTF
jgi:Family of unknown function (DUF6353)